MEITFRQAEARDADAAVALIYASGPDAFNYVLTTRRQTPQQFLRMAFIDGAGEFGAANHVVGVVDGQVVAAGAGWGADRSRAFTLAAARQFARHYGVAAAVPVIARGLQAETIMPPPKGDEYYVGHLGVAPSLRGRGIGEALVQFLLRPELRPNLSQGRAMAVLDVSEKNQRAEALYRRLGFTVTKERPSALRNNYGFVPGHKRMVRAL